jgi:hypothetical protein
MILRSKPINIFLAGLTFWNSSTATTTTTTKPFNSSTATGQNYFNVVAQHKP